MSLNVIAKSFENYRNTHINFDNFHNQVINMPRAKFEHLSDFIKLLKSLASYILLIDKDVLSQPINPKEIYHHIFTNYKLNIVPSQNRNAAFENEFLEVDGDFDDIYDDIGRRFRHYTEYLSFFDI